MTSQLSGDLQDFQQLALLRGRELYRDLAWRNTRDPYAIWVSEVMLQQTQVSRVEGRWQRWLMRFPDPQALAEAASYDVLDEWQGLGYNRRALALKSAAQQIVELGYFPSQVEELVKLKGIGPATAGGIRAFAFNLHSVYLETNVRTVFLHHLFPDAEGVPDSVLKPLVDQTCPAGPDDPLCDPRTWYYALLDYGAHLKKTHPNPSRRSKHHAKQSRFEGSHRQKRAEVVRILLDDKQAAGQGLTADQLSQILDEVELKAGRPACDRKEVDKILEELNKEGFTESAGDMWYIR